MEGLRSHDRGPFGIPTCQRMPYRMVQTDYPNCLTRLPVGPNLCHVLTEQNGIAPRKCASLTTKQADAIFFPGPGGKVNKSRQFCSDCPVKDLCLNEALDFQLEGFWAGTTDEERRGMRRFRDGVRGLGLEVFLPPELPKKRRVYRKVTKAVVIHAAYLDELDPTDVDVLSAG